MIEDYFVTIKEEVKNKIPEFNTPEFQKIRNDIKKELSKKETDLLFLIRNFKTLILGDWNTSEQKQKLTAIKNTLLKNRYYAETIDQYYDMKKKGGLSQIDILELCCTKHQLIVFIDGTGTGTVTEQNYFENNYVWQGKILFFIQKEKFDRLKEDPSQYIKNFPTIIPYAETTLSEDVLVFSRFRLYRLAGIIFKQEKQGKGLKNPQYMPWKTRLKEQ